MISPVKSACKKSKEKRSNFVSPSFLISSLVFLLPSFFFRPDFVFVHFQICLVQQVGGGTTFRRSFAKVQDHDVAHLVAQRIVDLFQIVCHHPVILLRGPIASVNTFRLPFPKFSILKTN